ncbi:putative polysaccharide biosynthesis protein [Lactiplantibacillus mudanjiangensis]|uniref:Transporter [Lactobacillus sp.] n=1 Tax=Lactiplantibacillus mudanjiangensis TaxID=1296538 RepID=A0A660DZM1_9LACO|nr:polysaccharide biosynthesis protein [Lactiplantibacillus mudanjiangensis]VDG18492.1 transporter [Lactobacillus sp.] [Lactiplantibacillus mudanjiangensis]VDG25916.1 transporter [Lactobacillus sp.] [Lactiplantibacillus mudanjiangensis]VDG28858.1 transporter [Lactobacillus sp.] [Lactiplantibacillus mudanjiangensis]VDG33748.1 transporter [Lactobacillus sp.] [Lactiplantibacillus mudanjiangensis]
MSEESQANQPQGGHVNSEADAHQKMVRGSAWMTAGSLFSRILGAIYIIPWVMWLGSASAQGNALYAKGYNIYSFFLLVAIGGIPSAISKQVSEYNAMNEYGVGQRLFKRGLLLTTAMGIVAGCILWFGAQPIGAVFGGSDPHMIPVLRALAIALVIIPSMSLTRGFFQGYQEMAPSAVSQFVEQVFRVVYMLAATYFIMRVQRGDWVNAITQSTFAAFIGAAASFLLLGWHYYRKQPELNRLAAQSNDHLVIPVWQLFKDIIIQAIPFIVIDTATTVFNLFDQATFQPIMEHVFHMNVSTINTLYALFAFNSNKLVMIIVSLASAIAITVVPLLSESLAAHNLRQIRKQLEDALILFLFIMIPGSLGMAAVAYPLNTLFYGYDELGALILQISAFTAIILGLFTVTSALMQGLSRNRDVIRFYLIGLIVKLIIQVPCVIFLSAAGPLVATAVGMAVASFMILYDLEVNFGVRYAKLLPKINRILIYSILTYLAATLVVHGLNLILNEQSKLQALVIVIVAVAAGGAVYAYFALKSHLADLMIGSRAASLRRKLRIK